MSLQRIGKKQWSCASGMVAVVGCGCSCWDFSRVETWSISFLRMPRVFSWKINIPLNFCGVVCISYETNESMELESIEDCDSCGMWVWLLGLPEVQKGWERLSTIILKRSQRFSPKANYLEILSMRCRTLNLLINFSCSSVFCIIGLWVYTWVS